ncbi:hypothetical protein ACWDSJ_27040 [Nocardia sp. NPDC003482]|uniref:hypothetical protein n=1 Tax=Nocardia sp. NPDC004068 TaxID=3364303 RepID=UPI00368C2F6A
MTRFLAVLSGLLLTVAVAVALPWAALAAAALVVAGWWWRICAVGAVFVALGALAWADPGAPVAAATGVVATTYLLNIATVHAPKGVVPTTLPSVAGALIATGAAVAASVVPAHFAWLPLAAPVLVILAYAGVVRGVTPEPAPESTDR